MPDMRFALLNTNNNAGLIGALGAQADVIPQKGSQSPDDLDEDVKRQIFKIAERNVRRRQIRYPWLFGKKPVADIYRRFYRRKCIGTFLHFRSALQRSNADAALVFNGYLAPNALFDLAAQQLGISILYLENGFFPHTMQADRSGINALSTLPRDAAFYDQISERVADSTWPDQFVERRSKLRDGDPGTGQSELPNHYIFVPFQVPSDMQILALSPWIKNMVDLYQEVFALAERFPQRSFVIKEHPSFPLSIQDKIKNHPRIQFCNHGNTRTLIDGSDAVLTVNSTVGLEALASRKKVITLGDAHYAIEGCVLKAANRAELQEALAQLEDWSPDEQRRDTFVRFAANYYLLPIDRENPGSEAKKLLELRVQELDRYHLMLQEHGYASTANKS